MIRLERVALVLFVSMTCLRLALAATLGLGDDEAYYWDWSRRLALSYYDHPAMVAWLIKLGTSIFSDTTLGVRFFGLAANAASAVFIWRLACELFDRRIAALALILYTFAPIFTVGGILMVPDAPMAAAWTGFTWISWRLWAGSEEKRFAPWLLAGVVLGLGCLSKYTMILTAVSAVILFGSDRERRKDLLSVRFLSTVLITIVFCLPILIWNFQYDWPSIKFQFHDRQTGGGGANLTRWTQFWVSQMIVLGPGLFVVCVMALVAAFRRSRERRWKFIALFSAPPLLIFATQALFAEFKPHWPAPAYPLLFIGASARWFEWKPLAKKTVAALVLFFFALINVVFHVGAVYPIVPILAEKMAPRSTFDPKNDPTNDLYGWSEVAAKMASLREEAAAKGEPPLFLSSYRYQHVAQLAFATKEEVWRLTPATDFYSFTQPTQRRLEELYGRSALFVSDNRFQRDPVEDEMFETCTRIEPDVEVRRAGHLARTFYLWKCQGYKGWHGDPMKKIIPSNQTPNSRARPSS